MKVIVVEDGRRAEVVVERQVATIGRAAEKLPPSFPLLGMVTEGLDVVLKIAKTPVGPGDRPKTAVVINKVTIQN